VHEKKKKGRKETQRISFPKKRGKKTYVQRERRAGTSIGKPEEETRPRRPRQSPGQKRSVFKVAEGSRSPCIRETQETRSQRKRKKRKGFHPGKSKKEKRGNMPSVTI